MKYRVNELAEDSAARQLSRIWKEDDGYRFVLQESEDGEHWEDREGGYFNTLEEAASALAELEERPRRSWERRPGESPEHYKLRSKISDLKREETRCGWAQIRSKYQHMRDWYGKRMVELRKEMAKLMGELKKLEAHEKDNPYTEPDNTPKPIEGRSLETLRDKVSELKAQGMASHREWENVFKKYAPYEKITPNDQKLIDKSWREDDSYDWPYDKAESIEGFEELWNMMTSAYHRAERQAGID